MTRSNCTKPSKQGMNVSAVRLAVMAAYCLSLTSCRDDRRTYCQRREPDAASHVMPVRVPAHFSMYRDLLASAETGEVLTAEDIARSMPSDLLDTCGSPLPSESESEYEFLGAVISFGTNMISCFGKTAKAAPLGGVMEKDRFNWLVRGLRQEPGIVCRMAAIAVEGELIGHLQRSAHSNPEEVYSLSAGCFRDYLPETSSLLIDILHCYRCEKMSPDAAMLYSDVELFLRRLALSPRDYAAVSADHQAICDRLYAVKKNTWGIIMSTGFTGFLKADIKLHHEKDLLQRKISEQEKEKDNDG